MSVIPFPTLGDKLRIHVLINQYAQGLVKRDEMMTEIAQIIQKYGVDWMPVYGYRVRILQYFEGSPIISIEGAKISDHCPACLADQDHARYLRTEIERTAGTHDVISQTCLECGTVYMSEVENGRRVNSRGRVLE